MTSPTGQIGAARSDPPLAEASQDVRQTHSPKVKRSSPIAGSHAASSFTKDPGALQWRSQSTASLPLTNASKVTRSTRSVSPSKPKKHLAAATGAATSPTGGAANAGVVAAESAEGHLPEVLPPLPPSRVRKG